MKLNIYYNTRKSEWRPGQSFKEMFGRPKELMIRIGDWEQKKHPKSKEPVKGTGFRMLLREAGYSIVLVNEWGTNHQCTLFQVETVKCEKFRVSLDPRARNAIKYKHRNSLNGLLLCQPHVRLWCWDVNGTNNKDHWTWQDLEGRGRPSYLSHQTQFPKGNRAVTSTD